MSLVQWVYFYQKKCELLLYMGGSGLQFLMLLVIDRQCLILEFKQIHMYFTFYSNCVFNFIIKEFQFLQTFWYYNRVKLKSSYDVSANSKICLDWCIAESLQSNEWIETYHGENGDEYDNVENEHMGLFKIEDSENDQNGTGLYSGQFWEILYKLI